MGNNQSNNYESTNNDIEVNKKNELVIKKIKKSIKKKNVKYPNDNRIQNNNSLNGLDIDNINLKIKDFEIDINKEENDFNENEKNRRLEFEKKQNEKKKFFESKIIDFENKYDPYKIFNLNKDCSLNDIKNKYKKLALKYHPDKSNNTEKHFQVITQCYLYLINKYKEDNKNNIKINEPVIKKEYEDNINKDFYNIHLDKDNFNIDKFNEIFDKYKLPTAFDNGYTEKDFEEFELNNKEEVFSTGFNIDIFNNTFNKNKNNISKEIIEYQEPMALGINLNQSILGCSDTMNDFGDNNNMNALSYTDYKRAYTTESKLINPEKIKIKNYKNINELYNERENLNYNPSEEEKKNYENIKNIENENEILRQNRLQYHDREITDNYFKYNSKLLK